VPPVTDKKTWIVDGYALSESSPVVGLVLYKQKHAGFEIVLYEGNRGFSLQTCHLYERLLHALRKEFGQERVRISSQKVCDIGFVN
tara:strand:+ start:661 stop:918 length:258 start_codon:yes stop_codon:yes gene_type:complete